MKTLKYKVSINKPIEFVFNKMIEKSTYPQWAKAWGEGMTYDGDWKQGEYIVFHDQKEGGTKAIIEEMIPYKSIKMKHVAMVNSDAVEVELTDDMMKKWIGSREDYFFTEEEDSSTKVEVIMEADEVFEEMMEAWPVALVYLKEICEND